MVTATAEKKATAAKPEVAQATKNTAELIKKDAKGKLSAENKTVAGDKELFERLLPENVTPQMVKDVFEALEDIYPAAQLAVGEVGVEIMKKHPEVDKVVYSLPLPGRNRIDVSLDRSRTVPQRQEDGSMGSTQMYGYSRVDLNLFGTRNRGQITAVKEHLSALASKALNT